MTDIHLLFQLVLLTFLGLAAADSQALAPRLDRSLVNSFPFNANEADHHGDHHEDHDGHHGDHHEHHEDNLSSRLVHPLLGRQYGEIPEDPPTGKKCVQKENIDNFL